MHRKLRRAMEGDGGEVLLYDSCNAEVLHDKRVHARFAGDTDTLFQRGQFFIKHHGIDRLMHLYRCAERLAEKIIESCQDMETCLEKIANINLPQTARS